MSKYHVTYYYLATGMEGGADKQDHGVVEAESKDGAIRAVLKKYYANYRHDWEWISGCLTARLVKMAGPESWDKRRSGRTRSMLAAAMRQCFGGRHVYVVISNKETFSYCVPILQDMGATRIHTTNKIVEFGSGCEMHFKVWDANASGHVFGGGFELRGIHQENVFWDHEAVRRKYNQIIQRFHEYD